ncbi:putative ribonuclease H-like domain-containing protein [Tanacetum coccineum]
MNEFCAKKGIKREFSVARTPQQNGVAERKNRTLIEAARTMVQWLISQNGWTPLMSVLFPQLRIHKNHPKDQILGDPKSAVQTRGKIQKGSSAQTSNVKDNLDSKQKRTNHKDHQNCLFSMHLSQEEPKLITILTKMKAGLKQCKKELLQFTLQKHQDLGMGHFLLSHGKMVSGEIYLVLQRNMCIEFLKTDMTQKKFQNDVSMGETHFLFGTSSEATPEESFISQENHIYYALTENPIIFVSLIEQFWETAVLSTTEEGLQAISATIDGHEKLTFAIT